MMIHQHQQQQQQQLLQQQHNHFGMRPHHSATMTTSPSSSIPTPTVASGPLSFSPPRFKAARREAESSSGSNGSNGRCFTLVSHETGRRWRTISSLRGCQFGEVLRAVEVTATGEAKYFAIKELLVEKILEMQGRTHEDPFREVSALQFLSSEGHVNILECTEALRDREKIYIVTPFYDGGEVFDVLAARGRLGEDEARPLFLQVLEGLQHLKQHGVCHRDLSLENLLMDGGNNVKLIDFGLALRIPQTAGGRAKVMLPQGPCGKQHYMSPEVLLSSAAFDGFAVDIWACGIMLFILLTGVPPFELALPSQDQRCRVVAVEERLAELLSVWKMPMSPQAIDLIQSCLLFAPERRATLEGLRNHPWFSM